MCVVCSVGEKVGKQGSDPVYIFTTRQQQQQQYDSTMIKIECAGCFVSWNMTLTKKYHVSNVDPMSKLYKKCNQGRRKRFFCTDAHGVIYRLLGSLGNVSSRGPLALLCVCAQWTITLEQFTICQYYDGGQSKLLFAFGFSCHVQFKRNSVYANTELVAKNYTVSFQSQLYQGSLLIGHLRWDWPSTKECIFTRLSMLTVMQRGVESSIGRSIIAQSYF